MYLFNFITITGVAVQMYTIMYYILYARSVQT